MLLPLCRPYPPSETTTTVQHIQELRVADQELHPGNQKGRVFASQLSLGAVAVLTDRPVAEARVIRMLRQAIEEEEESTTKK